MTQQTNKDFAQPVPLTEFVDAVFAELSSLDNEWNPHEEGYGYFDNPDCWKNTIIPLAVRLNKLAQTDLTVYWWLLREMSEIDICKDGEEYFGKGDVYALLLNLDGSCSRYILENGVPEHADELQEAMKAEDLDAFMSHMPAGEENSLIYNVCRVLRRVEDVRRIYKETLSYTSRETLGSLFLLIRRLFNYFDASYFDHRRPCDGMARNVLLALCHTAYYGDKVVFSDLMDRLGELWIRGLRITYLSKKAQMPPLVSQTFFEVFQGDNAELLEELRIKLDGSRTEDLKAKLIKSEEGWLELEKYSFACERMRRGCSKPPYDWKRMPGGVIRIYREEVPGRYRVVDRLILDNDPIPMEELKALAISEEPANAEVANGDNGSVVNPRGPLYPESKWGFIPDDYFELKPSNHSEEYFDRERFEEKYKAKGLDHFAELINYLAEEKGCVPDDDETKALLAYRLTGLNRPAQLKKIFWTGITSKDSPLELYYLVKYWVVHNHKKNPQCDDFFKGPRWEKNPSSKVKDCSHEFQRKLKSLFDIPTEYK